MTMHYEEYVQEMKKVAEKSPDNPEKYHSQADQLLTDFLHSMGFVRLVEEYDQVKKWYA